MYLIGEIENRLEIMDLYRKNWLSVVKALIEKRNVDVNSVDSVGRSLLHVACR